MENVNENFLSGSHLNGFVLVAISIIFWWLGKMLRLTSSCSLWNFSFFLIASCTLSCIKKIWKEKYLCKRVWSESESELTRCIVSSKLCCGPPFIWKCLSLSCVCCERKGMEKMNKWICWAPYIAEHWIFFIEIHEYFINLLFCLLLEIYSARSVCFENVQLSVKRYNEIFTERYS